MSVAVAGFGVRRSSVAGGLPEDIDGLLVTAAENVRYLTGFSGSHGAVLIDRGGSGILATDGRYLERAAAEAPGVECVEARRATPALVEHAVTRGIARLGYDAGSVTVEGFDVIAAAAGDATTLVRGPRIVEALRAVKDPAELEAVSRACEITAAAFHAVIEGVGAGVTERELDWQLQAAMRANGAQGPAFDAIVAFGPHSAIPHHEPTDRPLARGDLMKFDFGACVDGYRADMTRTVVLGPAADWQRELHAQVAHLQAELRRAAVAGTLPRDLDAAMRKGLTGLGHDPLHGLGHGVGLAIHEDPFLTENSPAPPLEVGTVFTIEPGIYQPGRGGVRIEDTLVITESGESSALTETTRALLEV